MITYNFAYCELILVGLVSLNTDKIDFALKFFVLILSLYSFRGSRKSVQLDGFQHEQLKANTTSQKICCLKMKKQKLGNTYLWNIKRRAMYKLWVSAAEMLCELNPSLNHRIYSLRQRSNVEWNEPSGVSVCSFKSQQPQRWCNTEFFRLTWWEFPDPLFFKERTLAKIR